MKQAVIAALAVSVVSAGAYFTEEHDLLYSGLERRSIFGGDSTTNVNGGPGGSGGKARSGNGGPGGRARGATGGLQRNTGSNGGLIGATTNNFRGANLGQKTGSASGGVISGTVVNNAGAPMQFGGDMWTSRMGGGSININSNSGMGGVGNGGSSDISGNNNPNFSGVGGGAARGGRLGGDSSASGNTSANGASSGSSFGGRGGGSSVGGGNTSKGGDSSLQFSPTLSVPAPAKRALERRALELEEEYAWVMHQKRDLEGLELIARFNVPFGDSEELRLRSADPEAELFYAREAEPEFDDEDAFEHLTARDILEAYLLLTSDY